MRVDVIPNTNPLSELNGNNVTVAIYRANSNTEFSNEARLFARHHNTLAVSNNELVVGTYGLDTSSEIEDSLRQLCNVISQILGTNTKIKSLCLFSHGFRTGIGFDFGFRKIMERRGVLYFKRLSNNFIQPNGRIVMYACATGATNNDNGSGNGSFADYLSETTGLETWGHTTYAHTTANATWREYLSRQDGNLQPIPFTFDSTTSRRNTRGEMVANYGSAVEADFNNFSRRVYEFCNNELIRLNIALPESDNSILSTYISFRGWLAREIPFIYSEGTRMDSIPNIEGIIFNYLLAQIF